MLHVVTSRISCTGVFFNVLSGLDTEVREPSFWCWTLVLDPATTRDVSLLIDMVPDMLPLGWTGAGPQFAWGAGLNNPQAWEQLLRMWGVDADPAKIREMMERGQSTWGNMNQVCC